MSHPDLMDVDVSMAEKSPQYEDQDKVALAKERNFREVNAENPTRRLQEDLEAEVNKLEIGLHDDKNWENLPTDDNLDERVGSGKQRSHHGRHSPVPSVMSMKSDQSLDHSIHFTGGSKGTRIDLDKLDSVSCWSSVCELSENSTHFAASQHSTEPGGVLCAVCPKRAFKSCLTCMASFCGIHVKPHYTAPALQRHKLVEATEDLEQRLCPRHNRELELYCRTDQTAICVLCVAVGHNGHDVTELGNHQQMQIYSPEMEKKTAVPPPGPIEFSSVKPDSVCVCWGPPEGLPGPHTFRVTWTGEGNQEQLEVQDLKLHVQELSPGEKYTFTVATLTDDGRQSPCVSATVQTDIPPPGCIVVEMDLPSVSVKWSKPAGVDQASYLLTLSCDGKRLQTTSTKSLHHCFSGLEIGKEYNITVSTILKGGQSKPLSKIIRTSVPVPENLTVGSVTPTSAVLSWSLHQEMEQIPHRFLISYHSEGAEPQAISTESCSTTLTGLQPDTQYTVTVCCELRNGGMSRATTRPLQTDTFGPKRLSVDVLDPESDNRWMAVLSWSLHQEMEQIPHSFLISYHSEGAEPQTISTESCSTTLTGLQPDTQYTVTVCTELQGGEQVESKKSKSVSTTLYTSERRIVLLGKTGERRIVLLGKTGDGKSTAGNTILEEELFKVDAAKHSVTSKCEAHSKIINGRKYTVIDTFFDTHTPEKTLKQEIANCVLQLYGNFHSHTDLLA
ncbi:fibronectin-like [Sardina pilchardus]|uniref:fibronectin-like n=1 Tax=Sardina pilchardus TaxID=27697 RepID=UPI002E0EDCDE